MVDTGVDNEHPGLNQKFVAGYDAVCYFTQTQVVSSGLWSKRNCGTYDPDDGHQHGTACMGMQRQPDSMHLVSKPNFTEVLLILV